MKTRNTTPSGDGSFWASLPPLPALPGGDTLPPFARVIAYNFARTGALYRVDVREMNFIAAQDEPLPTLALCAVSRKVFAGLFDVDNSTVSRWLSKGLPVLEDGFFPYDAARCWHQKYQEDIARHRANGRLHFGETWEPVEA